MNGMDGTQERMVSQMMHVERIDNLSERLAQRSSRRRFAHALVGGGAAALIGVVGAAAKTEQSGKAHGKHKVGVCLLDRESDVYSWRLVATPAVKGLTRSGRVADGISDAAACDALNTAGAA
jgi:hypothetical protein